MPAPERSADDLATMLHAHDTQLRADAEMTGARSVTRDGPLLREVFSCGGFVSYASLEGVDDVDALIERAVAHFRDKTEVPQFEWKTRGHDAPADLGERLVAHGFEAEELETVMAGGVEHLVGEVELPSGLRVRRAGESNDLEVDVERTAALQHRVFGGGPSAEEALERLQASEGASMWLVERDDEVLCGGRLEMVPDTDFAGLWGGATHPDWRGRGLYRALTAARARYAKSLGVRFLYVECSPMSQPIMERSGLSRITTTTPYVWERG